MDDMLTMKRRLAKLLHEKSYLEGDFTLTSGQKSDYYFDCRQSSLNPEGAWLIGHLFLRMMRDVEAAAVAGMTMGADPLVTATSLAAYGAGRILPALIVRKEVKGHGTARAVEGLANVRPGDKVLVLEDVVSTGGSVLKACKRIEEAQLQVAGVFCILDRLEGGEAALREAGYSLNAIFDRQELVALAHE
jgi:orotate phosphoribosyltransferase